MIKKKLYTVQKLIKKLKLIVILNLTSLPLSFKALSFTHWSARIIQSTHTHTHTSIRISMQFNFCKGISVMLNDNGTLFHLYLDILISQTLFETIKSTLYWHFKMVLKGASQIVYICTILCRFVV